MLVAFIFLLTYSNCALMATYLLYGLGPSVTSISSSEGWSGQPTLNFPADTSKHPSREASGVQFNKGDHLSFSTHFDNQGADYITAILWIYRNNKEINEFFQIGHNFSKAGYAQGVGELTLETKSSGSKARAEINGDDVSNADDDFDSNKWNLVGLGWGNNKAYFKIKRDNGGDEDNNRTHTVITNNESIIYDVVCDEIYHPILVSCSLEV